MGEIDLLVSQIPTSVFVFLVSEVLDLASRVIILGLGLDQFVPIPIQAVCIRDCSSDLYVGIRVVETF